MGKVCAYTHKQTLGQYAALIGAVVAVCACQPSTQASLQQWIRELQLAHPQLTDATIVYDIRTDSGSSPLLEDGRVTLAGSLEEPATT